MTAPAPSAHADIKELPAVRTGEKARAHMRDRNSGKHDGWHWLGGWTDEDFTREYGGASLVAVHNRDHEYHGLLLGHTHTRKGGAA